MNISNYLEESLSLFEWNDVGADVKGSFMRTKIHAINNYKLTIKEGEVICILGKPGIGKTEVLQELLKSVDQRANAFLNTSSDHKSYKSDVAMIYQNHKLFPWLTVIENIAFGLEAREFFEEMMAAEVRSLLYEYDLWEVRDLYPQQLTEDEHQRTVIAQVMAVDPSVVFMDEPFIRLDMHSRNKLNAIIGSLSQELKKTVILSTCDIETALKVADKIVLLNRVDEKWQVENISVNLPRPRDISCFDFLDLRLKIESHI